MTDHKTPGFATRSVHAGMSPDPATGARQTPIYQTTSYVFESQEHAASLFALQQLGFIYSRLTNPTVSALEERLAALEGGVGATATSSGHAAQLLALFTFMEPGAEIVAAKRLYGGTISQFRNSFPARLRLEDDLRRRRRPGELPRRGDRQHPLLLHREPSQSRRGGDGHRGDR